ncbi:MAG: transcription-repair coupling factor, partial [Tannerella sp.]|nr:transcription-repair coupling factor [Tannerella sp.]
MEIQDIISLYDGHPLINAVASLPEKNRVVSGLHGSGKALITTALYRKKVGVFLCLLNDLEDAGYFYNDIAQLLNDQNVYFFPSAYHRHIKYGHTDSVNEILRTEVLGLLQEEAHSMIIVSYPDAISEKVLSKKVLQENTLLIHAGEKLDIMFVSDVLDSYGFEHTDYVYEPGQYAMRGSILDIFSFSNEYPFRIDFFGSEVESIRSFDVETQLSKNKLNEVRIIPEISKHQEADTSLFDLLPK